MQYTSDNKSEKKYVPAGKPKHDALELLLDIAVGTPSEIVLLLGRVFVTDVGAPVDVGFRGMTVTCVALCERVELRDFIFDKGPVPESVIEIDVGVDDE